jgi:hypothetical protein
VGGDFRLPSCVIEALWPVVSSAPLMRWVQMIDGDVGESALLSEVWWVGYCFVRGSQSWDITSWSNCRFLELCEMR